MKMINILTLVLLLSGCSLMKYWPTPHDPALAQGYVDVKISLDGISCEDKTANWNLALQHSKWLREYASFRSDVQLESADAVDVNLTKAYTTESIRACQTWLNLSRSRMNVLNKAWSGR